MWAHNEVDRALHLVISRVHQVGDAKRFPQALGFESLDLFLSVSQQGPCLTATEECLLQLELACEADDVASPDLAIAAILRQCLCKW